VFELKFKGMGETDIAKQLGEIRQTVGKRVEYVRKKIYPAFISENG